MADAAVRAGAAAGRRQAVGQAAVAVTACLVAACAVVFAGSTVGRGRVALSGLDIGALEAQAAAALPGVDEARTQDLASTDAFGSSAPPSTRGVVYGNDDSGDDVELEPISSGSSGARTQALYDTAGINAGGGGVISSLQRATVSLPLAVCAYPAVASKLCLAEQCRGLLADEKENVR